jgi:hypothetical protein
MSYDIDLIDAADQENGFNIGIYSTRLSYFWNKAMLGFDGVAALDGMRGMEAAPHLAHGAKVLLAHPEWVENGAYFEGEYEEATCVLVKMWQQCRENPTYTLKVSY